MEGFHAVQSFCDDKITANKAHEIGVELANAIWGDRYQVIVATHVNTKNIHNHFVINPVSFVDGKRFYNSKRDYGIMRNMSDKIIKENGYKVLNTEFKEIKFNKYATSSIYKELMKYSIDCAIGAAKDYNEFIYILESIGYIVSDENDGLTIRKEPYKRNTRIERQFGNRYSKGNICKQILETQPEFPFVPNVVLLYNRAVNRYNEARRPYTLKNSVLDFIMIFKRAFKSQI